MGRMFYSCPLNICLSGCQKIIKLPEDSCLTGCKWTTKPRLKTTCQSSSAPGESLSTASRVTKTLSRRGGMEISRARTWNAPPPRLKRALEEAEKKFAFLPTAFGVILTLLFMLAPGRGVNHWRLVPNCRERAWPLTSAHWLIAATVCLTVSVRAWVFCILFSYILFCLSPIPQKTCSS